MVFSNRNASGSGSTCPGAGESASAVCFFANGAGEREHCEQLFEQIIREEDQRVLGWRDVPTRNETLGATARRVEPVMRHLFIGKHPRACQATMTGF